MSKNFEEIHWLDEPRQEIYMTPQERENADKLMKHITKDLKHNIKHGRVFIFSTPHYPFDNLFEIFKKINENMVP